MLFRFYANPKECFQYRWLMTETVKGDSTPAAARESTM